MKKRLRPTWDDYFMRIAEVVASRSPDPDTQVGSVIIDSNKRIVATGYNGLPSGVDDDFWPLTKEPTLVEIDGQEVSVTKYMITCHSECNAIVSSATTLKGCTIYTTHLPCLSCTQLIITAGISKVIYKIYRDKPENTIAHLLMTQAGVQIVELS